MNVTLSGHAFEQVHARRNVRKLTAALPSGGTPTKEWVTGAITPEIVTAGVASKSSVIAGVKVEVHVVVKTLDFYAIAPDGSNGNLVVAAVEMIDGAAVVKTVMLRNRGQVGKGQPLVE